MQLKDRKTCLLTLNSGYMRFLFDIYKVVCKPLTKNNMYGAYLAHLNEKQSFCISSFWYFSRYEIYEIWRIFVTEMFSCNLHFKKWSIYKLSFLKYIFSLTCAQGIHINASFHHAQWIYSNTCFLCLSAWIYLFIMA